MWHLAWPPWHCHKIRSDGHGNCSTPCVWEPRASYLSTAELPDALRRPVFVVTIRARGGDWFLARLHFQATPWLVGVRGIWRMFIGGAEAVPCPCRGPAPHTCHWRRVVRARRVVVLPTRTHCATTTTRHSHQPRHLLLSIAALPHSLLSLKYIGAMMHRRRAL